MEAEGAGRTHGSGAAAAGESRCCSLAAAAAPGARPWPFPGECRPINPGMKHKAGGVRPTSPHTALSEPACPIRRGKAESEHCSTTHYREQPPSLRCLPRKGEAGREGGAAPSHRLLAFPELNGCHPGRPGAPAAHQLPGPWQRSRGEQSTAEPSGSEPRGASSAPPTSAPRGPRSRTRSAHAGVPPFALPSVAPARFAPRPVRGPGKRGGSRCQRGLPCLLRFGYRALVLSPCAQPILPSAGPCRRFEIYRSLSLEFSMWP